MFLFQNLEKLLYLVRDFFWNYPESIFFGESSLAKNSYSYYKFFAPFSHILLNVAIFGLIIFLVSQNVYAFLRIDKSTLVEGVIIGVDSDNTLQQINRINPLINTNIQLEKDLNELIYESLIKVDQYGNAIPVLADFLIIEDGKKYGFKLKPDLLWQDGTPITTADIKATFELIQSLDEDPRTSTLFSRSLNKMELRIIDDYSVEIILNSIIPGFYESMSFKIMPAHLLGNLNRNNISLSDPLINRRPVGSGPYRLTTVNANVINLVANTHYRDNINIKKMQFKLFPDESSAINALKSGEIHSLTGISYEGMRLLDNLQNVQIKKSNVIYNQYWGIYFNLGENGPESLKDVRLRRALAHSINKQEIVEILLENAEVANGPIPPSSFAYYKSEYAIFDKEKASKLFEEAGWILTQNQKYRQKDNKNLTFEMVLVDNQDRNKLAELIKNNLEDVGVELIIKTEKLETLQNLYIIPRQYQLLLYGVQTFIDPDRYELFHSSQIQHPGLNISAYKSEETVLAVVGTQTEKIPKVDDALNDARKFLDKDRKLLKYSIFQETIAKDQPIIFLYYPKETYITNKRLKNVNFESINSIEERFKNIYEWEISIS
jgi:peptide/nickel transport system substrate-binding protein